MCDETYGTEDTCLDCYEIEEAAEEVLEWLGKQCPAIPMVSDLTREELERGIKSILRGRFM